MRAILKPEDLKNVSTFAPQESLRLLNEAISNRLLEQCRETGHIAKLVKVADISGPDAALFADRQWGYVCRICGNRLRPINFEEI